MQRTLLPLLAAPTTDAAHPAVIEFHRSQGCSSCPPARATLVQAGRRGPIVAAARS